MLHSQSQLQQLQLSEETKEFLKKHNILQTLAEKAALFSKPLVQDGTEIEQHLRPSIEYIDIKTLSQKSWQIQPTAQQDGQLRASVPYFL